MSAWFRHGWASRLFTLAALAGLGAGGCGKKAEPAPVEEKPAGSEARDAALPVGEAKIDPTASRVLGMPMRDKMHAAFADVTRGPDDPPLNADRPEDRTLTGKSTATLYEQVVKTWDDVRFKNADGKAIHYVAELSTSQGIIKLAMLPEFAPNHARNFIVLAKLGYYDGLRFDRIHREPAGKHELHCLEGGCPLGTGDVGAGSVGYWMKDEFTPADKISHTEGVVGAFHLPEADTAATKFYVNLADAPFRDGEYAVFAKVIEGLDVARTISKVAVTSDGDDVRRARPVTPVVIHKVTIHARTDGAK